MRSFAVFGRGIQPSAITGVGYHLSQCMNNAVKFAYISGTLPLAHAIRKIARR